MIKLQTAMGYEFITIDEALDREWKQYNKYLKQHYNMEKKYKLIKAVEVPSHCYSPYGRTYVGEIHNIGEWVKIFPWMLGYTLGQLPDWFELVEEKEFTRSDMIKFGKDMLEIAKKCPSFAQLGMDNYLNSFIKNNKQ